MKRSAIITDKAPSAIGPYSQAISLGELVFVSGQIPLAPDGNLVVGGIAEQTEQCLENIRAILVASRLTMSDVVKTTVFLSDLQNFSSMNEVYSRYFKAPYPARSTVQVAALPKGALIEIESIAVRP